jgi:hypothetical protein
MSPSRNVTLHQEGMEIIANLIEKYQKLFLLLIQKAIERATIARGINGHL